MANQSDPKIMGKAAGKEAVGKVMELTGVFNNRSDLSSEQVTGLTNSERIAATLGDRKDPHSEFSQIHFSGISAMAGARMLERAKDSNVEPKDVPSLKNNMVLAA